MRIDAQTQKSEHLVDKTSGTVYRARTSLFHRRPRVDHGLTAGFPAYPWSKVHPSDSRTGFGRQS
jgi:hypothetical protein